MGAGFMPKAPVLQDANASAGNGISLILTSIYNDSICTGRQ